MRRQSDVSLSQHYWKQHAVTAAARKEFIHPAKVFVFTLCGKGGKLHNCLFVLVVQSCFWDGDRSNLRGSADNWAQDKSVTVIN